MSITTKNIAPVNGSLRELLIVAFPLMLSLMSGSLMFFFGRLLLAGYSIEAHNAAASAGMIVAFLEFPLICTVCIAEVFVGQSNGAGQKHLLAIPVWQMLWLSLFSVAFFFPIAMFGTEILFQNSPYQEMESSYFSYLIYFSPIFCAASALSAFYIGRRVLGFVTFSVIISNILNIALSYLLIFGYEPYIPSMGINGAAIATGLSQLAQFLILLIDFLRPVNRQNFGTGNYQLHLKELYKCIKIGLPSSIAHTIEILAWALFFRMLIGIGPEHATVVLVAQSIFFLFTFMTEGISKAATTIAANLIGAGLEKQVWKLFRAGVRLYLIVFVALGVVLVLYPAPLINLFVIPDDSLESARVYRLIANSCFWVWLFFLLDGIHWLVVGLLTAAGDTKYVLKVGGVAIWLFALLPTYLFVVLLDYSADTAWAMTVLYGSVVCVLYLGRFFSGRWKEQLAIMS